MGWVTSMVQQAEASQKRINEFLKEEPALKHVKFETHKLVEIIEFKNLSFTIQIPILQP